MKMGTTTTLCLCLIMLIQPVFGNIEVNSPEDYFLIETPTDFVHVGNMRYGYADDVTMSWLDEQSQEFCSYVNIRIYGHLFTFSNKKLSILQLRSFISELEHSDGFEYYHVIDEIYGLGDEAYYVKSTSIKHGDEYEKLFFSKDHVLVKITPRWESDISSNEESGLIKSSFIFAEVYEEKIDLVLNEEINNEKTASVTYATSNSSNIPFLNPFIVAGVFIVLAILLKRQNGE